MIVRSQKNTGYINETVVNGRTSSTVLNNWKSQTYLIVVYIEPLSIDE